MSSCNFGWRCNKHLTHKCSISTRLQEISGDFQLLHFIKPPVAVCDTFPSVCLYMCMLKMCIHMCLYIYIYMHTLFLLSFICFEHVFSNLFPFSLSGQFIYTNSTASYIHENLPISHKFPVFPEDWLVLQHHFVVRANVI